MFLIKVVWCLVVFATLATCKNVKKREIERDIHHYVVGPTVQPHQAHLYRYQVALQESCKYICGGTIISDRHILTAAHCLKRTEPRYLTIKAGVTYDKDPNGQVRNVVSYKLHKPSNKHDFALLTLQEPLNLTGLTVAKLPEKNENFQQEIVELSGWGNTENLTYGYFTIQNYSINVCGDSCHLLAYATDKDVMSWPGDSGSPVVLRRDDEVILVGVHSGGFGNPKLHIFGNVAFNRDWIDQSMNEAKELGYAIDALPPHIKKPDCV